MTQATGTHKQGAQFVVWALLWTVGTKYGGKLINLLTTIVLAWLLAKEDFGLAGYALVFVTFIEIFEGFGVESALVYNKEDRDLADNAFWISACTGTLIAILVYFCAPLAGLMFNDQRAIPLVEVLSLAFLFTGLRIVPKALMTRRMQFKRLAIPEFTKVSIKGFVAIGCAFFGFGPWSIINSVVFGLAAEMIAFWIISDWRPSFRFIPTRAKTQPLLTYGGGLIGLSIVGTLIENIDYVFVGRYLGAASLGVYMLGFRLPTLLINPVIEALSRVLFPLSVHNNTDRNALLRGWTYSLRYIAIFTVPIGFGIFSVSEPLVLVLFGIKWIDAVPVVSAIALQSVFIALAWHTGDIYKAIGKIRQLFWLAIIQFVIVLPLVLFAVFHVGSVGAVAYAHVVAAFIHTLIRLGHMAHIMRISPKEIFTILVHPLLAGVVMGILVLFADGIFASYSIVPWVRLTSRYFSRYIHVYCACRYSLCEKIC